MNRTRLVWVGSLILSLAGLGVTIWLLAFYFGIGLAGCGTGGGCGVVLTSRLATIFGYPTALFGFSFYLVEFTVLVLRPWMEPTGRERIATGLFWFTLTGFLFSLGLMIYSVGILGEICSLCTASFTIVTGLTVTNGLLAKKFVG